MHLLSAPRRLATALVATALSLLAGLTLAAGSAQAAFPGTNGLIACSGPLGTIPAPTGTSFLELFTMDSSGAMEPDGSPNSFRPTSQVRLTTNTTSEFNPRYSADGTKIAFVKQTL